MSRSPRGRMGPAAGLCGQRDPAALLSPLGVGWERSVASRDGEILAAVKRLCGQER